jgi:hypothetical protein
VTKSKGPYRTVLQRCIAFWQTQRVQDYIHMWIGPLGTGLCMAQHIVLRILGFIASFRVISESQSQLLLVIGLPASERIT